MAVYTKIFVKFPKRFWPEGEGREFFLYASTRRGYYGIWQVHKSAIQIAECISQKFTRVTPCLVPKYFFKLPIFPSY
jgi:hypothetical protein